jgi:hypothetical protein
MSSIRILHASDLHIAIAEDKAPAKLRIISEFTGLLEICWQLVLPFLSKLNRSSASWRVIPLA